MALHKNSCRGPEEAVLLPTCNTYKDFLCKAMRHHQTAAARQQGLPAAAPKEQSPHFARYAQSAAPRTAPRAF